MCLWTKLSRPIKFEAKAMFFEVYVKANHVWAIMDLCM